MRRVKRTAGCTADQGPFARGIFSERNISRGQGVLLEGSWRQDNRLVSPEQIAASAEEGFVVVDGVLAADLAPADCVGLGSCVADSATRLTQ